MKKLIFTLLAISVLILFYPSCKTAEAFVWTPAGNWTLQVSTIPYGDFVENVTLTGSASGGTLTGWTKYNPSATAGSWSKTADFTITVTIDYINVFVHNIVDVTANSTESNPNFMTGAGTWTTIFIVTDVDTLSWTGTKTSNLQ